MFYPKHHLYYLRCLHRQLFCCCFSYMDCTASGSVINLVNQKKSKSDFCLIRPPKVCCLMLFYFVISWCYHATDWPNLANQTTVIALNFKRLSSHLSVDGVSTSKSPQHVVFLWALNISNVGLQTPQKMCFQGLLLTRGENTCWWQL